LGILAAIALPKFIDLTNEALTASTQGVAGAVSSANAINYGAFAANSAKVGVVRLNNNTVCSTATLGSLLQTGWPSAGSVTYTASACDCTGQAAGTSLSTTITGAKGAASATAAATIICTG